MYDCEACGEMIEGETASLWFDAPLGLACVHAHRTQKCARQAVLDKQEQGWKFRRSGPPLSKVERAQRDV